MVVLSRQNRSRLTDFGKKNLPKVVPRTTFAAKIGPARPILAAKNQLLHRKSDIFYATMYSDHRSSKPR